MKYSLKERLDIGKRIYLGELTLATAAYAYDINMYTARDYLRMYKASAQLTTYDGQDEPPFEAKRNADASLISINNLRASVSSDADTVPNTYPSLNLHKSTSNQGNASATEAKLDLAHLRHMTKEELIAEVIKAKEENLQRQG